MRWSWPQPYEVVDHTADTGVRVRGDSPEEVLARLVLGYADLVAGGGALAPESERTLQVPGQRDRAALAVDVLRAVHHLFTSEKLLPAAVDVIELSNTGARLRLACAGYDPVLHREGLDIKAITYHAATFTRARHGYEAQVIVDI